MILEVIEYINRWVAIIPTIVAGASIICALTPTPKDDQVVSKIYKIIEWCAFNVGKAKQ
tara:strand:- start:432 stop:608 length:177 start_codon:yes stop_codon:yes gene_type:complete